MALRNRYSMNVNRVQVARSQQTAVVGAQARQEKRRACKGNEENERSQGSEEGNTYNHRVAAMELHQKGSVSRQSNTHRGSEKQMQ